MDLTFSARRCKVIHKVAEEIIQLHRESRKEYFITDHCTSFDPICAILRYIQWLIYPLNWLCKSYWIQIHDFFFYFDLVLQPGVLYGLEDVPGVSAPHLHAGHILPVPALDQNCSSDCLSGGRAQDFTHLRIQHSAQPFLLSAQYGQKYWDVSPLHQ